MPANPPSGKTESVPPSEAFAVRRERTGDWYLAVDEDELSAAMCLREGCRCMGCDCGCPRVPILVALVSPGEPTPRRTARNRPANSPTSLGIPGGEPSEQPSDLA